ncbi:MAG: PAS domain S-box protein, partial [Ignavibacteriaceae bacterium]
MSTLKNKSKSELIEEIESLKKRIKECERIKDMLQESEERFHNIFEHSGEGIFLINPKGYFLDVNQKICQMFGYTRQEFLQVHVTNLHP